MTEREQIEQTIALLEGQRADLGDAVVDAVLAPLREKLAALQKVSPAKAAFRGERRQVTVLFADIAGFTQLSETMDPETIRDLINDCFSFLVPVIEKYGGTVDKFLGDGVMVLFGAPVAHENDPERALHAALDMKEALSAFNAERQLDLALHFGVNTGMVVAGSLGTHERQEYSVIGDAVNIASRLEEVSPRGQILVGPDTYRLTAPLFDFSELEPIPVKGKAEVMPVYRLERAKPAQGKMRGIAGLSAPLVGRAAPLAALRAGLEGLRSGPGAIVTLVGEAGLGKSRLVAEVRKQTPGPLTWVESRCLSYGSSIAYLPWIDALRGVAGVTPDAPAPTVRKALREMLQDLCPECLEQVYPYLARLIAALPAGESQRETGMDGETLRSATFRAVELLLNRLARRSPLVLVCEDLHWADPTSLALLEHLLPLTAEVPLLLLAVLRPEQDHGCWQLRQTAAQRYPELHRDLWLDPLSPSDSQALVGHLLRVEDLPPALRERILRHAEGNPFYVEELIRSLMDCGAIAMDEASGRWRATRSVEEITLPDTLHGVLMARIDRLRQETRHILQLAAVIGRTFLYRVLAEIAHEEQALDEHLQALVQEQMIREQARDPELEYIFKHQLTQEAAYDTLLKQDRRIFHRQVAEALERLFPERSDALIGLLAHHWDRAGEPDQARPYLRRAGDLAARQFANSEALQYYQRALELLTEDAPAQRFDLLLARNLVYDVLGQREQQGQDLETMAALAEELDDDRRRGTTAWHHANYLWALGDFEAAVSEAQSAIRLARATGDPGIQAWGYFVWGRVCMYQGRYGEAAEPLLQGLELAREAENRLLESWILRNIGNVYSYQWDQQMAQYYVEQALQIHRELGDRGGEAAALNTLGLICRNLGDLDGYRDYMEQALQIADETGIAFTQGMVQLNLGILYSDGGDQVRARELYQGGLAAWRRAGNRAGEGYILRYTGWTYYDEEQLDQAKSYFEQALQIAQEIDHLQSTADALMALGRLALHEGNFSAAQHRLKEALALYRQLSLGMESGATALMCLGKLFQRLGAFDRAEAYYQQALELTRRSSPTEHFPVLLSLGSLAHQRGQDRLALEAYLRPAQDLAERVGLTPMLAAACLGIGHALSGVGELEEAEAAYKKALEILRPLGRRGGLLAPLAGLARLALQRGEPAPVEEMLEILDQHGLAGVDQPMRIYLTCYQALRAGGDPRAAEILARAQAILQERAAAIEDPALRHSYLEEVDFHREILELFRAASKPN
ncbi:MAG: tetratricopeptide repeat protein [Chloroflexia bacterium]|nr:tetratricopeptide repeat protein [Chloroflexia bacterium]